MLLSCPEPLLSIQLLMLIHADTMLSMPRAFAATRPAAAAAAELVLCLVRVLLLKAFSAAAADVSRYLGICCTVWRSVALSCNHYLKDRKQGRGEGAWEVAVGGEGLEWQIHFIWV